MPLTLPDIVAIAGFFLVIFTFAFVVRKPCNFREYAIGNSEIPGPLVFAGLAGAYIGPGYTLGFCTAGFDSGFLYFFLASAFSIQMIVVGRFIVPRLKKFQTSLTVGDIIASKHGRGAQLCAGFISVALCTSYVALLAHIAGTILNTLVGTPIAVGVAFVTAFGIIYSFVGGLKSVIATEAMQFCTYSLIIPILVLFVGFGSHQQWRAWDAVGWDLTHRAFSGMSPLQIGTVFLGFLLGETLIPPTVVRALSAPAASTATRSFIVAGLFSTAWFGLVVGLGVLGKSVAPLEHGSIIFWIVTFRFLPHFLIGLVVVAVLSLILSCQQGVLNAGAVSFTRDIWEQISGRKMSDGARLKLSGSVWLGIGLSANLIASFLPESIIASLMKIYTVWACSVLPTLIFAIILPRTRRAAALPSMALGILSVVVWEVLHQHQPQSAPAMFVGLLVSTSTYGSISLFSDPDPQEVPA
jgi:solute:Na+ symporter, SSS family